MFIHFLLFMINHEKLYLEGILEVYKKRIDISFRKSSNKSHKGQKIYSSNDCYDIPFIILTDDFTNLVQMAVARRVEVNIDWSSLQPIRNHLNLTNSQALT